MSSELRGIFGEKGDSRNWLDATSKFPNQVPRFQSKAECIQFMEEYNTHHGGSNPEQPHLMHIFTMLTSWERELYSCTCYDIHVCYCSPQPLPANQPISYHISQRLNAY